VRWRGVNGSSPICMGEDGGAAGGAGGGGGGGGGDGYEFRVARLENSRGSEGVKRHYYTKRVCQ
jgi:hypothetical protein